MERHSNQVVRTSDVIGKKVLNPQKEDLGTIEEIVLDKVNGDVRYAVLSFGGFLGLGDKLFAIPWKSISYDKEEEGFILAIDQNKLKQAPGFDKDNWPDFSENNWIKSINDYYQV